MSGQDELAALVARNGAGAKLKRAVMKACGWREPRFDSGDAGDWYRNWPALAPLLESVLRARSA